jgi:cytoskeletal protein CcmA (bactofilin family)
METKPIPTVAPTSRPNLTKSVLSQDVEITGSLTFKGELSFDEVTISGTVKGNATVSQRCHLRASARLNGDLNTSRLIMEEGATFIGMSNITPRGGGPK